MITELVSVLLSVLPSRAAVGAEGRWHPETASYPAQKAEQTSWIGTIEGELNERFHEGAPLEADVQASGRWSFQDQGRRQIVLKSARATANAGSFAFDLGILPHAWSWADAMGPFDLLDPLDLGSDIFPRKRIGSPGMSVGWRSMEFELSGNIAWPWTASTLPDSQSRPGTPLPIRQSRRWFPQTSSTWRPDLVFRGTGQAAGVEFGILLGQAMDRTADLAPRFDPAEGLYLTPLYARKNVFGTQVRTSWNRLVARGETVWLFDDVSEAEWFHDGVFALELDGSGWIGQASPTLMMEYHRSDITETALRPLQNDLLTTLRIGLNDTRNSEISATGFMDADRTDLEAMQLDASTLILDALRLSVGLRWIGEVEDESGFSLGRKDSYVSTSLRWSIF